MAVYASLSLIKEVISLKLIQILQSFPQSLNDANSSSSMDLSGKKPTCSLVYKTLPGCQRAVALIL